MPRVAVRAALRRMRRARRSDRAPSGCSRCSHRPRGAAIRQRIRSYVHPADAFDGSRSTCRTPGASKSIAPRFPRRHSRTKKRRGGWPIRFLRAGGFLFEGEPHRVSRSSCRRTISLAPAGSAMAYKVRTRAAKARASDDSNIVTWRDLSCARTLRETCTRTSRNPRWS